MKTVKSVAKVHATSHFTAEETDTHNDVVSALSRRAQALRVVEECRAKVAELKVSLTEAEKVLSCAEFNFEHVSGGARATLERAASKL
jgi:hypothetical protein